MKKLVVAAVVATLFGTAPSAQQAATTGGAQPPAGSPKMVPSHDPSGLSIDAQNKLVAQNCASCHSEKMKAGELVLAGFDAAKVTDRPDVTEKMIRKLRAGMMPPPGARRPDAATIKTFFETLEAKMDAAAALKPNPGWRPFQRLNRAEYQHAVKDLLGIDVDVNAFLPPDTISKGFDNVADVQAFSPTLMESYLRAASSISRLAIGDRGASATSVTYKIGRTLSQMRHVDGAPMGTRGGISVVHTFPADGEYTFKVSLHNEPLGGIYGRTTMATMDIKEQIEVSVNGERAALLDLNVRMSETDPKNSLEIKTPPIHVPAGPQRVSAAFIQRFDGPVDDLLVPLENTLADVNISFGVTALPHMRDMTILGPAAVTGVSDTISRRMVFTCRPTNAKEEETCAAEIVKGLTARAFRGAGTPDDVQDAMAFYEKGRKSGDFEAGIRMALQSVLMSPRFLFRLEQAPAVRTVNASATYRLNDQDLASRLSFFLWGTAPDADLLKAASAGTLRTTPGLEKQVRRMLADRRADALSTRFAAQWLRLQDLEKIHPDYLLVPAIRRHPRPVDGARDGAVLRQHRPRRSAGARPADGRLQLRERAARQALWHRECHRQRFQADPAAGVPPRPAGAGQHPHADVIRRPHLAGPARQVDSGSAVRRAAAAPAAERAAARRHQGHHRRKEPEHARSAWKSTGRTRRARRATR